MVAAGSAGFLLASPGPASAQAAEQQGGDAHETMHQSAQEMMRQCSAMMQMMSGGGMMEGGMMGPGEMPDPGE